MPSFMLLLCCAPAAALCGCPCAAARRRARALVRPLPPFAHLRLPPPSRPSRRMEGAPVRAPRPAPAPAPTTADVPLSISQVSRARWCALPASSCRTHPPAAPSALPAPPTQCPHRPAAAQFSQKIVIYKGSVSTVMKARHEPSSKPVILKCVRVCVRACVCVLVHACLCMRKTRTPVPHTARRTHWPWPPRAHARPGTPLPRRWLRQLLHCMCPAAPPHAPAWPPPLAERAAAAAAACPLQVLP